MNIFDIFRTPKPDISKRRRVRAPRDIGSLSAGTVLDDREIVDDVQNGCLRLGDGETRGGIVYRATPENLAPTCNEALQVGAAEERDALLSALGWKTGPFPDAGTRKVVLEDSAGLRPEMVKARRRADDAEADRDIWRMIAGERVEEARSGLLIRVWNRMKEERKLRIKAEAAIAGPAAEDKARIDFLDMRRPIKGIEYRSAEEVFAIMADRIRLAEGGHYRLRGTSPAEPERDS